MGLEVKGIDAMVKELERKSERGERAVNKALRVGGQILVNEAIKEAPVGNPDVHLRNTIKVTNVRIDDGGTKYVIIKQGSRRAFYGHIVEEKTKPFMKLALNQKGQEAKDTVAEIIKREMGIK